MRELEDVEMLNLIKNADENKLAEFLADYANQNPKFAIALKARFSEQMNYFDEISNFHFLIDEAIEKALNYRLSGSFSYLNIDTSEVTDEINERARQGHIKLAFDALKLLYTSLLAIYEYQDECEVSDEIEDCLDHMVDVAKKASLPSDKEFIHKCCVELAYYYDEIDYEDYQKQLLAIADMFVTDPKEYALEQADILEQSLANGNIKSYGKLKAILLKTNQWDETYPNLMQKWSKNLPAVTYMNILVIEQEYDKLMESLRQNPNQVFSFGVELVKYYKDEVWDIFLSQIRSKAEVANNNDSYKEICKYAQAFADAGYANGVSKLAEEFMTNYKRRRNFVSMLSKLNLSK